MPAHGFSRARQSDLAPDPRGHPNPIQYEFNTNSIRIQSGSNPTERINYPRFMWRN